MRSRPVPLSPALLSDPAAQARIRRSQDDVEHGDVLDEDEMRAMLARRRMPDA